MFDDDRKVQGVDGVVVVEVGGGAGYVPVIEFEPHSPAWVNFMEKWRAGLCAVGYPCDEC
jgi:hypothetical protein